jgi:hypothetical protein
MQNFYFLKGATNCVCVCVWGGGGRGGEGVATFLSIG